MPTSLFLAGWEAAGLRCPDHAISFEQSPDEVFPISLLQMPNGTGKTTTLQLLRATLSGAAEANLWTPNQVRSFGKRGNENGTGFFRATLLVNGRRATIGMNFDFDQGTVHYTTTLSSGMKKGFHPPQGVEKFLVPDFVNFFVFDGELAEHLLDRQHTDAQTVIDSLFQLSLFAEVSKAIEHYYDGKTQGRSATEERGFARRRNRVDLLRERVLLMKDAKAKAQSAYESTKRSLTRQKAKFDAALEKGREHGEKVRAAHKELAAAESVVQKVALDLLGRMRDPHALSSVFAAEMVNFKASLDRAKLPESTAREFFEELADEAVCVCGRELDDHYRTAIRERAKQYLGSDDVAFLNNLKGDVATLVGTDPGVHEADADRRIGLLMDAINREDAARTVCDTLEADAVANDPTLGKAKDEIERLDKELLVLDEARKKYDSPDDSLRDEATFGIKILERRLDDAEQQLAEITQTINLRKKRGVLTAILAEASEQARAGISQEISEDTNKRIAQLMPDNAIRVQRVESCLVLEGQEGGSAGETLSIAYAFLSTLFTRVEHQLPFVVDSPAGPIDLRVRAKVAELIPHLAHQFVAFTISSERQNFLAPLQAASSAPIQYITMFRKGASDIEQSAMRQRDKVITSDGVLVTGKDFFSSFHFESEDNARAL